MARRKCQENKVGNLARPDGERAVEALPVGDAYLVGPEMVGEPARLLELSKPVCVSQAVDVTLG